jgi:proteasome accessory factor B
MSDSKTERLINLTIALLATRRYLTKSEIFNSVAGYEGSPETMERMFERDKDELRALGIHIEVGNLDPLFDDEPGYRITRENYGLNLGELTAKEVSYISLAAHLWRDGVLSSAGARAFNKISEPVVQADVGASILLQDTSSQHFESILNAIEERRRISFDYFTSQSSHRTVEPYELVLSRGFWYLVAFDRDRGDVRTFKLARISGDIALDKKTAIYEINKDLVDRSSISQIVSDVKSGTNEFANSDSAFLVALKVKKERARVLRMRGTVTPLDQSWDLIEFYARDIRTTASEILWWGSDVVVVEPLELKEQVLENLRQKHGVLQHG